MSPSRRRSLERGTPVQHACGGKGGFDQKKNNLRRSNAELRSRRPLAQSWPGTCLVRPGTDAIA